jgi:hypothetical protein
VGVIDRHPHRGIETVTHVIDDVIEHYDNQGNKGAAREGRCDVADDRPRPDPQRAGSMTFAEFRAKGENLGL